MSTLHRIYFNGVQIEGVADLAAREVERNYDRDKETVIQETNIGTLRLTREINDALFAYLDGGVTGATPGIFEGPAYREEMERDGVTEVIFDGYVDLTENHTLARSGTEGSEVVVKEKDSPDFLNDVVDRFSFEYLESIGQITSADYIWMPYILNSVPDYQQSALTILSVYVMIEQVKSVISHIAELGVEMTNPFEVTSIVRMVLYIAYLIGLFIALAKLVQDIVRLLIQPVKYHACMSLRTLLEKGAAHLGYSFYCPFFDDPRWDSLTIMPEKLSTPRNISDARLFGYSVAGSIDQKGYFKGTYGDLLRIARTLFNGKIVVDASTITLLRIDQGVGVPEYQLAHEGDSNYLQPEFELNTDEFFSNFLISFETDVSDKNTSQEFKGTNFQVIITPITVDDPKRNLMKRINEKRIPLALAKRKEDLTLPEKIIKSFLDVFSGLMNGLISAVNVVIEVYNGIVDVINDIINALEFVGINVNWEIPNIDPIEPLDLGSIIENRLGMLKIENDQFNVPKIFMIQRGSQAKYNKIRADNASFLSARTLWDEFHFIDSFVPRPGYPNGNQAIRRSYENIPFTFEDDQKVKRNNRIFDYSGNEQELLYLKYRNHVNAADIKVRFSTLWTTNLQEQYIEPDGQ